MTPEEMTAWDDKLAANPDGGSVFQSAEIAEVKRTGGWAPVYLECGGLAMTVLERSVALHGKFWYIPKAPGVADAKQLAKLLPEIKAAAKKAGAFMVKIEPEIIKSPEAMRDITSLGLTPVRAIQPNASTVLIDLSPSLEDILAGFNQKGRHAINRAKRDGVTAKAVPFTEENARVMYDLLVSTAAGRFEQSIRPFDYYKAFWKSFYDTGRGSLFFAYFAGQVVSAAFAMYMGRKGTYKDGASVRDKQVYGASHLLQWEIIQWMKAHGCTQHDLCGAPPSDRVDDTTHPHYGIGRFKTSFNKQVTDYVGAFDVPLKPLVYKLWTTVGERLTFRLYFKKHHQSWY
jgi:lipid II:glycine glycyltransferase (peptidoglycan interpeptide bridge formation enzyme)